MPSDLIRVQEASNLAHKDFLSAIELNFDVYQPSLLRYLNKFSNQSVDRRNSVMNSAEYCKKEISEFKAKFSNVIFDVGIVRLETNLFVGSATTTSLYLILEGFSSHLDEIVKSFNASRKLEETEIEANNSRKVEQLKADAENVGYAVALVEKLAADLIFERMRSLGDFCDFYLHESSPREIIKSVDRDDIVKVLFSVVTSYSSYLALAGPIKEILDIWNRKRKPRAGAHPGDTDILLELKEMLEQDTDCINKIAVALQKAKEAIDVLRVRDAEAKNSKLS